MWIVPENQQRQKQMNPSETIIRNKHVWHNFIPAQMFVWQNGKNILETRHFPKSRGGCQCRLLFLRTWVAALIHFGSSWFYQTLETQIRMLLRISRYQNWPSSSSRPSQKIQMFLEPCPSICLTFFVVQTLWNSESLAVFHERGTVKPHQTSWNTESLSVFPRTAL